MKQTIKKYSKKFILVGSLATALTIFNAGCSTESTTQEFQSIPQNTIKTFDSNLTLFEEKNIRFSPGGGARLGNEMLLVDGMVKSEIDYDKTEINYEDKTITVTFNTKRPNGTEVEIVLGTYETDSQLTPTPVVSEKVIVKNGVATHTFGSESLQNLKEAFEDAEYDLLGACLQTSNGAYCENIAKGKFAGLPVAESKLFVDKTKEEVKINFDVNSSKIVDGTKVSIAIFNKEYNKKDEAIITGSSAVYAMVQDGKVEYVFSKNDLKGTNIDLEKDLSSRISFENGDYTSFY